jgi:dipeptidyl aminopeptidase/acylaminoacyl peptidase
MKTRMQTGRGGELHATPVAASTAGIEANGFRTGGLGRNALPLGGGVMAGLIILCALLAGCRATARGEHSAPLESAAWPTSRPTPERAAPTPFPRVDADRVQRVDDITELPFDVGGAAAPGQSVPGGPEAQMLAGGVGATGVGATIVRTPSPASAMERSRDERARTPQSAIDNPQSYLVFQLTSGGEILVVNADGSGLRRLTQGIDPVLSPDGERVAFTRWDGTDGSLWLIGIDGSDERQVAGGIKQAKHPTWSPDGGTIAVNFQHEGRLDPARKCANLVTDGVPDIPWNVDEDSVKVEMKDQGPTEMPYLCYTAPPDPHWSVRLIDLATGTTEDPTTDSYAFGPEWDPVNSWRIITSGIDGLTQLDVNRGELWALTDRREDHTPVFSPDGKAIAVAYNSGGRYDIHLLDGGGGARAALTSPPLWLAAEGQQPWNSVAPAWSPDGSHIAFLTDRTGRWEIWVMGADGANPRPMFGDALNARLDFKYDFVDERMLSWGPAKGA